MMFDSHRKDGNQGLHVKHGHMVNYQMLERTWYPFVLGKQVERRTPSLKMQIKFFLLLQGVGLNWTNRSSQRPTSLGLQDACLMYIIIIQVVSAREKAFIYNEKLFFYVMQNFGTLIFTPFHHKQVMFQGCPKSAVPNLSVDQLLHVNCECFK